jgi:hypothetical protein
MTSRAAKKLKGLSILGEVQLTEVADLLVVADRLGRDVRRTGGRRLFIAGLGFRD